jgi:hypothetical protein
MTEKQIIAALDEAFGFKPKTPAPETENFYMCYVEGASGPTVKHLSLEDASSEAERLTELTGKPTYLLHAVACCIPDTRLDVLGLVEKAIKLGQHDIAKALLTCHILANTAEDFIPKDGEFSDLWFETAAKLK